MHRVNLRIVALNRVGQLPLTVLGLATDLARFSLLW
jgi:hypothetical protein